MSPVAPYAEQGLIAPRGRASAGLAVAAMGTVALATGFMLTREQPLLALLVPAAAGVLLA